MMNKSIVQNLLIILATAGSLLAGGCSQSLAPPFPEIAPFPSKVLTKDEQSKAIDALTAAKQAQDRAAQQNQPGATVQNAVARSSFQDKL